MSDPTPEYVCWNRDAREGEPWDYCGSPLDHDTLVKWSAEYQSTVQYIVELNENRNLWQETVTRSFAELQEPMRALRSHYPAITNMNVTRARNAFILAQLRSILEEMDMLDDFDRKIAEAQTQVYARFQAIAALEHGLELRARGFGPPIPAHMVGVIEDDDPGAPPLPTNITEFPTGRSPIS